jgi:hypothetical protein
MGIRKTIRLPNTTWFDIDITNDGSTDKAKPSVRKGRKAAGAEQVFSMAELPKDEPYVVRLFGCYL